MKFTTKKRIISLIIGVALLFSVVPAAGVASAATSVNSITVSVDRLPTSNGEYVIPGLYKLNGSSGILDAVTDWYVGWAVCDTESANFTDYDFCNPEIEGYTLGKSYALYIEAGLDSDYVFSNSMVPELDTPSGKITGCVNEITEGGGAASFYYILPAIQEGGRVMSSVQLQLAASPAYGKAMPEISVKGVDNEVALAGNVSVETRLSVGDIANYNGKFTQVSEDAVLQKGKAYIFDVTVRANGNNEFTPGSEINLTTPKGTVNGDYYNCDSDYTRYQFMFNFGAPTKLYKVKSVDLYLKGYKYGAKTQNTQLDITVNGTKIITDSNSPYGVYAIGDRNQVEMETGKFKYDTQYYLIIKRDLHKNYDTDGISKDKFNLNGITAEKIHFNDSEDWVVTIKLPKLQKGDPCNGIYHEYQKKTKKATFEKSGKTYNKCSVCDKIANTKTINKIKYAKLSDTSYTYNGKAKNPTVKVIDSKGNLISEKYYTVSQPKGRKKVGKYKVTVKFKTRYSGTKNLYFTIKPPKTSVSKLSAGKKSLKVTVKKQSEQTSGYQIQYSTSKKFAKSKTKSVTVKGYKNTKKTLKKLKANKTYYVRVRTYKTVDKTKYYSSWSDYKTKKTK